MIIARNINKNFGRVRAIDHISLEIKNGSVFGLVGTNGAGKSTFIRILCGILRPDAGSVLFDGEPVYENVSVKHRFFYISDDQYFFPNSTPEDICRFYMQVYPRFDRARFAAMLSNFDLDHRRKINTFSKGMKKQLSIICAVCSMTDYIFCDETFDGLDPVMRQAVKAVFAAEIADRGLTPVIASHNLREIEDICDHIGLLHKGGVLLSKDLDDMKLDIHKVQCIFTNKKMKPADFEGITVLKAEQRGSLYTLIVRGRQEEVMARLGSMSPVFYEILPLSLEEIFISETEVRGYDVKKLIF